MISKYYLIYNNLILKKELLIVTGEAWEARIVPRKYWFPTIYFR